MTVKRISEAKECDATDNQKQIIFKTIAFSSILSVAPLQLNFRSLLKVGERLPYRVLLTLGLWHFNIFFLLFLELAIGAFTSDWVNKGYHIQLTSPSDWVNKGDFTFRSGQLR